jgi:hypothetical protein
MGREVLKTGKKVEPIYTADISAKRLQIEHTANFSLKFESL